MVVGAPDAPIPPEALRWRVTLNGDERAFLSSGVRCLADFEELIVAHTGHGLRGRVLDFGAGCGRLTRWLVGRAAVSEVICCDTDAEAVAWCGDNLPSVRAVLCDPDDPCAAFGDQSVDAVICASVLTHVDLPRQRGILAGLARILAPRGLLALSTMGDAHAARLDAGRAEEYRRCGFCFVVDDGLWAGTFPAWYGTAFHSPAFLRALLNDAGFEVMDVHPAALHSSQDIAITIRGGGI